MIAMLGLTTKSPFTSFRLGCCGRFRSSQSTDFKATNAAVALFGYFFQLLGNGAALLSALKNNKRKRKKVTPAEGEKRK
jgi:hypothetical protein